MVTEVTAVAGPVERPVRPCAWISEYGLSELTTESEKLGSLEWEVKRNKERGHDVPLYDQAALDAAVAAALERSREYGDSLVAAERERCKLRLQGNAAGNMLAALYPKRGRL